MMSTPLRLRRAPACGVALTLTLLGCRMDPAVESSPTESAAPSVAKPEAPRYGDPGLKLPVWRPIELELVDADAWPSKSGPSLSVNGRAMTSVEVRDLADCSDEFAGRCLELTGFVGVNRYHVQLHLSDAAALARAYSTGHSYVNGQLRKSRLPVESGRVTSNVTTGATSFELSTTSMLSKVELEGAF